MARGCHRLIRQGARLVESTADILDELAPLAQQLALDLRQELAPATGPEPVTEPTPDDPDYDRLWQAMGHDPVSIDQLAERSGLSARELSSMLLLLEMRGLVERLPGGRVQRSGA
jgi:DNA processing protein